MSWMRVAMRQAEQASAERRRANRWINVAGLLAVLLLFAVAVAVVEAVLR